MLLSHGYTLASTEACSQLLWRSTWTPRGDKNQDTHEHNLHYLPGLTDSDCFLKLKSGNQKPTWTIVKSTCGRKQTRGCKIMPAMEDRNDWIKEWLEIPSQCQGTGKEQSLSVPHLPGQPARTHLHRKSEEPEHCHSSGTAAAAAPHRWANGSCQHGQNKCKNALYNGCTPQFSAAQHHGQVQVCPLPPKPPVPYWGSKNSSAVGNTSPVLVMFNFTSCVFVLLEEVKLVHGMFALFPAVAGSQTMSAVVWSDKSRLQDTGPPGD